MTRTEKEAMQYKLLVAIDDCIKSIQAQASSLKNPEDMGKNLVAIMKMQDYITDMKRTYSEIDRLNNEDEEIEEETEEMYSFKFKDPLNP